MSMEMVLISEGCRRTTSHKHTYTPNTTRCFTQEETAWFSRFEQWKEEEEDGWGRKGGAQQNTFSQLILHRPYF